MPVSFFRIAVLWDKPFVPTVSARHNLSCLEPTWTLEMGNGWDNAPDPDRTPETGAVLLTLAVPGLDRAGARALALGSATAMGDVDPHHGIGWSDRALCIGAWQKTLQYGNLFHQALLPWMQRGDMPPALLTGLASPEDVAAADGTLRVDGARVVGTGLVEGSWDAATFFLSSPLARGIRTAPDRVESRVGHLLALLAVGSIALGTGLVLGWMDRRGADVLALDRWPAEGLDTALTDVLTPCFAAHRTEAPPAFFDANGVEKRRHDHRGSDDRRIAFTGLGSSWKLLTRIGGGAKSRSELAEDVGFFLPRALWMTATWEAQGPFGASTLVRCPTETDSLRQRSAKMGMEAAFARGLALGKAYAPHDPLLFPALRADGWV